MSTVTRFEADDSNFFYEVTDLRRAVFCYNIIAIFEFTESYGLVSDENYLLQAAYTLSFAGHFKQHSQVFCYVIFGAWTKHVTKEASRRGVIDFRSRTVICRVSVFEAHTITR